PVVAGDLVRPQLGGVLRQEFPFDLRGAVQQAQTDVAEPDGAVGLQEVAGQADSERGGHSDVPPGRAVRVGSARFPLFVPPRGRSVKCVPELFDLDGVRPCVAKLTACYAKAGLPERFRRLLDDAPHELNAAMQAETWDWLKRWA